MATQVIRTVGIGGDYGTLAQAWAAIPSNLMTADEQWTLQFLDGEHVGPTNALGSKVCDGTRFIELTSHPSAKWNDKNKPLRPRQGAWLNLSVSWTVSANRLRVNDLSVELANALTWSGTPVDSAVLTRLLVVNRVNPTNAWINNSSNIAPQQYFNCIVINAFNGVGNRVLTSSVQSGATPEWMFVGCAHIHAPWTTADANPDTLVTFVGALAFNVFVQNNLCVSEFPGASPRAALANAPSSGVVSHNVYSNTDTDGGTNAFLTNPSNIFKSWSTVEAECDFRLKPGAKALLPTGDDISWLTTIDIYGDTRGVGGYWTRGPIQNEYVPTLVVAGQPIALTATLGLTGSLDVVEMMQVIQQGAVTLTGALTITGNIKASLPNLVLVQSVALQLTATLTAGGDVTASTQITGGGLPPGWFVVRVLENVPNPNFGTPYGQSFFARWTYLGYDDDGIMLAASGDQDDAFNQLLSIAQSRKQRRPYNED